MKAIGKPSTQCTARGRRNLVPRSVIVNTRFDHNAELLTAVSM